MINLAVIGCGNMASAIVGGNKNSESISFFCYDIDSTKSQKLAALSGGTAVNSPEDLKECQYFLIAVKPQQFLELADSLENILPAEAIIISIMAGTKIEIIQEALEREAVVRVMPNTPAIYQRGVSAIYFSKTINIQERLAVQEIFSPVSSTFIFDSEEMIDKISGVTGSGPALIFEFALCMIAKLEEMGVDAKIAREMVKETFAGSATLMGQSTHTLEELKQSVTSKGGITFEALKVFEERNLRQIVNQAIEAAYQRTLTL